MNEAALPREFELWDAIGLAVFALAWIGFTVFVHFETRRGRSLTGAVGRMRVRWMATMLRREVRIVDVQILAALLGNVTFFASTSILIVAGLFAALGAAEKAVELVTELPFAAPSSRALWEVKIAVMVAIFIYAFFKFGWAIRLHSYVSVLVGAVPQAGEDEVDGQRIALSAAHLSTTASAHFNDGVRAYYFGLAALPWFINPVLLIPASLWVVLVLYRREFHSHSMRLIQTALGERERA